MAHNVAHILKLVTSSGKTAKTVYKEKMVKQQGTDRALLRREINHFLSSPSYMLNCSLGALFMIAVAVFSLIKANGLSALSPEWMRICWNMPRPSRAYFYACSLR